MIQKEMIEAGVQFEAVRELGMLLRPLFEQIVRNVRCLYSRNNSPATRQSIPSNVQRTLKRHIAHIQD